MKQKMRMFWFRVGRTASSRAMSNKNCIPSQVKNSPWLWAKKSNQATLSNIDSSKVGKWMVFLKTKKKKSGCLTELDSAWLSLVTLVEENILLNAKCSTAVPEGYSDKDTGVIICYTEDYMDKTRVRVAAEAIHQIVKLKSPMYYKTDEATRAGVYSHLGHKNVSIYRFCPDSTFYERGVGPSPWLQIGSGGSSELLVPSKVTWLRWLWAGPEIDPKLGEHPLTGKWLLFLDQEDKDTNDLTELDRAWSSVTGLVMEGILLSAKCCTAATPSYNDPDIGVIGCYTPNYTDKKNVKEVADAIHSSIKSLGTLYYKTDEATLEHESTSIYMYRDRKLYEKSEELEWRPVVIN